MSEDQDRRFMARAITLASNGMCTTDPNPRVGCVIVKNGVVVGEGWHERAGEPHAEMMALQNAGVQAQDANVYVTLEPCSHFGRTSPCADALIAAKVAKVVVASIDPNPMVAGQGLDKLKAAGIAVKQDVLQTEAEQLNPGFMKRMRHQLPYVRCKIAMTMDGRTALVSGESQWITGEQARSDVHYYRARSSAIFTGIGTVLADDPSLNVRMIDRSLPGMQLFTDADQPTRVVIDSQLRTPFNARMLSLSGKTIIYTLATDAGRRAELEKTGVEVCMAENQGKRVDLTWVLQDLAARGINELLVEAGARINGGLLSEGLIDELVFYIAPSILGDRSLGAFHLPAISTMADKVELQVRETRQIGVDWRIIAVPELRS